MRGTRLPSFQFYPADFMSDPNVQSLNWDQRGRYFWALCCSWMSETPGVASEDSWRRWMGYTPEEWEHASSTHSLCFATHRTHGAGMDVWTQKRMVMTVKNAKTHTKAGKSGGIARAQKLTPEQLSESARNAANARWKPSEMPSEMPSESVVMRGLLSPVSNIQIESKNTSDSSPAASAKLSAIEQNFELFWGDYPRPLAKAAAKRAWLKHMKTCSTVEDLEALCREIMLGLDVWNAYWMRSKTEHQYTPHPATWLNQMRWKEKPE